MNISSIEAEDDSYDADEYLQKRRNLKCLLQKLKDQVSNLADVGGMDSVKEEISMKIIMPLKHPELYEAYGKSIGGGMLLYGPPGCGKTHIAREQLLEK